MLANVLKIASCAFIATVTMLSIVEALPFVRRTIVPRRSNERLLAQIPQGVREALGPFPIQRRAVVQCPVPNAADRGQRILRRASRIPLRARPGFPMDTILREAGQHRTKRR